MSRAHRRMHRRWAGKTKIPAGSTLAYCSRGFMREIRDAAGIEPKHRRWKKKEARREWRMLRKARIKRLVDEMRKNEFTQYYGIPIRRCDSILADA